jgi:hypothetical protein
MKKGHKVVILFLFLLLLPFSINVAFSATGIKLLYFISRSILGLEMLAVGLLLTLYFRPVLHYSKDDATIRQLPWGPYLIVFAFGVWMFANGIELFYTLIKTWPMFCPEIQACLKYSG